MMDFVTAQCLLVNLAKTYAGQLTSHRISIDHAQGRILAKEVLSPSDLPSFDNSGMDGYALNLDETLIVDPKHPVSFEVLGEASAGMPFKESNTRRGTCVAIMTGAKIPNGFNTVVKIEDTKFESNQVAIYHSIKKGQNVRLRGEDIQTGQCLLNSGDCMTPEGMMILAGVGVGEIDVYRRIKVSILTTGAELVDSYTQPLKEGQIRNSSAPYLKAFFDRSYLDTIHLGSISDQPDMIYRMIKKEIEQEKRDIIILTGGVSAGKYDYVPKVLHDLGVNILFHKVAQRPGKPILVGHKDNSTIFGLPGNPVSTLLGSKFYVEKYLKELLGMKPTSAFGAELTADVQTISHLHTFLKGHAFTDEDGQLKVTPLSKQGSAMIGVLAQTNCWIIVPSEIEYLKSGAKVKIIFQ